MFQTLFQISCFTAVLIVSISHGRTPSLEHEEEDIRELKAVIPRGKFFQFRRTAYQCSNEPKKGIELPDIKCGLHAEVVQVERNVTGLKHTPQFVNVTRCKGACSLAFVLQTCKPKTTLVRHVKVSYEDGKECVLDVEEHMDCECACQVTCNDNQILDENECKCNCAEKCSIGQKQHPGTCECTPKKRRNQIIEY